MILTIRLAKALGVVTAMAAVLSVSAANVNGGPPGGAKVFVISGKGTSSFSSSSSSNGNAGDCNKARLVVVSASIANGATGNTILAEAKCGNTVVADATALDPGSGAVDFQSEVQPVNPPAVSGGASCVRTYAELPPGTDSNWTVTCVFLFP
jgi:hypothetical protein